MYTIKSLIPFELLVDTDMGVLKYSQLVFADDERLFYPGLMEMIGPDGTKTLQYALVHRRFINPLSAIIKQERMITCDPDNILEGIMRNAQDVYKLSTSTAIMQMVCKSFFISEVVKFDILCKDNVEKRELLRRFKDHFKTDKVPANIVVGKMEDIDISEYGSIYLKDIHDIKKYKNPIEGKNIIIAKYAFNQEYNNEEDRYMELPIVEVINEYTSTNEIRFIDIYSDIESNGVG